MMREFQIWPHNSNRIRFEHFFSKKKTVGNRQNTRFSPFWQFLSPKKRSNLIRFEFWGQIWIPLIIMRILGTYLIWFSPSDFFDLPCIFKNLKLTSRSLKVLEIDFFVHHWTQRVWNHGQPLDLLSISKVGVFWTTLLATNRHAPTRRLLGPHTGRVETGRSDYQRPVEYQPETELLFPGT